MSTALQLASAMAAPDPEALAIATTLCILVCDGGALGELEERAIVVDGAPRTVRVPPLAWFDRLAAAEAAGVFERQSPRAIAERILTTEAPERA